MVVTGLLAWPLSVFQNKIWDIIFQFTHADFSIKSLCPSDKAWPEPKASKHVTIEIESKSKYVNDLVRCFV